MCRNFEMTDGNSYYRLFSGIPRLFTTRYRILGPRDATFFENGWGLIIFLKTPVPINFGQILQQSHFAAFLADMFPTYLPSGAHRFFPPHFFHGFPLTFLRSTLAQRCVIKLSFAGELFMNQWTYLNSAGLTPRTDWT